MAKAIKLITEKEQVSEALKECLKIMSLCYDLTGASGQCSSEGVIGGKKYKIIFESIEEKSDQDKFFDQFPSPSPQTPIDRESEGIDLTKVFKAKNDYRICLAVKAGAACAYPYCNCEKSETKLQ